MTTYSTQRGSPCNPTPLTPLRMQVVWSVFEAAKANNDRQVIDACRRLIHANRLGWRRYALPADWRLVKAFADCE